MGSKEIEANKMSAINSVIYCYFYLSIAVPQNLMVVMLRDNFQNYHSKFMTLIKMRGVRREG